MYWPVSENSGPLGFGFDVSLISPISGVEQFPRTHGESDIISGLSSHVETVALLGRKQVSDYLHIAVNTEDLETDVGRIYTNDDIKQYIEEKYGFKVHSAYIGQVREKLGIHQHENYHDSHTSPRKPCVCPEEKETAILDALKHFGLIQ